jgi:DNA-binding response OmpR family regulator
MVLIVNRNDDMCRSLVRYFRTHGVGADYVCSAAESLEYLKGAMPRVLILDQDLPDVTGLELLQRLRACDSTRSLDVVFYTDVSDVTRVKRATRLGAADWIVRSPKSREVLLSLVHQRVL